ncbi:ATP-binding protein [Telmatocola sphagniphila]|uniref:ATP-binding protein n=1 Tax=Telmatocola sphagniphila TaxID=1123043 RepID=A0A8E6B5D0_9BACT|nr:ATP-binding protein [Telmatocola sphagniphila]QVL31431.1 ATP-binding protein [Telmatocola sphagniphila]
MATAEQLKALIKSHTSSNDEHFRTVALQIAAHTAKQGNTRLADELRALVEEGRRKQATAGTPRAIPIARPSGELAGLVAASYPNTRLIDMVLTESIRHQLEEAVQQHRQRDRLRTHGFAPKRRLLLVGPPGCGKTMTATALAGECQLPLMFVQLHSLITKYMGETAAKLHVVFDAMAETRGVYLFDEFDAIGATRTAGNDVGEIRRVLNSFLQFMERDDSDSIIVAATNFMEMLDDALFRRFDDVIRYSPPNSKAIRSLIESRLSSFTLTGLRWQKLLTAAKGLSHAEVARSCDAAARTTILGGDTTLTGDQLVQALSARSGMRLHSPKSRKKTSHD